MADADHTAEYVSSSLALTSFFCIFSIFFVSLGNTDLLYLVSIALCNCPAGSEACPLPSSPCEKTLATKKD